MQLALPLDTTADAPPSLFEMGPAPAAPRFVRHRRARRYILDVLEDGTLRVTLPRWGSKREALAFVHESAGWIARQRALRRAAPKPIHIDEPALRARARVELPAALRALALAYGIRVARVSIRNQRSRWGACSAKGVVTLNWRLLLVPAFVREYVMLHELMHRRELNHSRKFWRLVAAVCPRYQEARRWLLREGQALFGRR
jgi:hypothetical protein